MKLNNLNNLNMDSLSPKKKFFGRGNTIKFIIPLLVLILISLFLYLGGWDAIQMGMAGRKRANQMAGAMRDYENKMSEIERKMANDTYGGKTPRETLDLFIVALENGDLDMAAKYFKLDKSFSYDTWREYLQQAKDENRIEFILSQLRKAVVSSSQAGIDSRFEFMILGDDGMASYTIDLILNKYSQVWKLDNL